MRTRAAAAAAVVLTVALTACAGPSGGTRGEPANGSASAASGGMAADPGCPADTAEIRSLLNVAIDRAEGATDDAAEQLCAYASDPSDPGALSVVFLRFPRPELKVSDLAGARRRYGTPLDGHTIVSMPSWGKDAFLDESVLPDRNVVAEIAWVPGFEVILGMHSSDPHAAERRHLIAQLVALTR